MYLERLQDPIHSVSADLGLARRIRYFSSPPQSKSGIIWIKYHSRLPEEAPLPVETQPPEANDPNFRETHFQSDNESQTS